METSPDYAQEKPEYDYVTQVSSAAGFQSICAHLLNRFNICVNWATTGTLFAFRCEVDNGGQQRAQQDPNDLVPIEERKSEELRSGPRIQRRGYKRYQRDDQQPIPGSPIAFSVTHDERDCSLTTSSEIRANLLFSFIQWAPHQARPGWHTRVQLR